MSSSCLRPLLAQALLIAAGLGLAACTNQASVPDAAEVQPTEPDTGPDSGVTELGGADPAAGHLPAAEQPELTPVGTVAAAPATLDEFLDRVEEQGLFNGVILVADGNEVTRRSFGLADREAGIPIDTETVFDTGSITKQFTGAAIVRLEMDGLLSVDDPLSRYLPGLPEDKADITLHELLVHTAGFPDGIGGDDDPTPRDEYLTLAAATPLLFEPGTAFSYSNVGYSLLAMVIEEVSGLPYEAYLRQALFLPAGMYDTGYVLPDWSDDVMAIGYRDTGEVFGRPDEQVWADDGPYWHLKGNGGILSSTEDMFRWHRALQDNLVLDEAATEKFQRRHVSEGFGSFYAYGWSNVPTPTGTQLITHNGGNGVFFADFLRYVDDDLVIYIATNSARFEFDGIGFGVAELLLGSDPLTHAFERGDTDTSPCGFATVTLDDVRRLETLDRLPDTPSGRVVADLVALLPDDDAAARTRFARDHLGAALTGGRSPEASAVTIEAIQEQLSGYTLSQRWRGDGPTFHLRFDGPGPDLLVSAGFPPSDPTRLLCLHLSTATDSEES